MVDVMEVQQPTLSKFIYLKYRINCLSCSIGKKIRYASRRARAYTRKIVRGRFVKAGDNYDYDPLTMKSMSFLFP